MTKAMAFVVLVLLACSKSEEPKCRAGTVLKDGKCVAEEKPAPPKPALPKVCEDLKATIAGCEGSSKEDRATLLAQFQKHIEEPNHTQGDLERFCMNQNQKVSEACAQAKAAGVAPGE